MTGKIRPVCWLAVLGLVLGGNLAEAGAPQPRLVERWGLRPLAFEENRGQTDKRVRFLARGSGYKLFLTSTEAVLVLRAGDSGRVLRLRWEGAASAPHISGEAELPGRSHYLLGNDPSQWRTGIPIYGEVRYQGVYPGIDLVFYGNHGQLEHDFVLTPGADPGIIRLVVEGADRLEIDPAGDLVIELAGGEVRLKKPIAYQQSEGARQLVESGYQKLPAKGDNAIGFQVAVYDSSKPLVIDPILAYSTYLGGRDDLDDGLGIAADAAGNAYVTGVTRSPDFPATTGSRFTNLQEDAFVTKLSPSGALVFSTYLGGSAPDTAGGIALDAGGRVYVAGSTGSDDFPRVNPVKPATAGQSNGDAFVAKLDPSGSVLLYSTNLGGSAGESGLGIAVDPQGHAYVTGTTDSPDFPNVNPLPLPPRPFDPNVHGDTDAFVTKLSPGGPPLVYSTFLGGSGRDDGLGIAVDAAGHALVTGFTFSTDFPTVNALQSSHGGGDLDAFVARLAPSGSSLIYSTYLGGASRDVATGIAERAGSAYITGDTSSADFPKAGAFQAVLRGGDAFISRLSPTGSLVSSTYLGGSGFEQGRGIAVDGAGNIHVTGGTISADFPLKDPVDGECGPSQGPFCPPDAFVTKLNPQGSALVYSTFLGGSVSTDPAFANFDTGAAIAADPAGNTYVTGFTESLDFPTVNAFQPSHRGGRRDAFVTRIVDNRPPGCASAFASPNVLWPPNGKLVPIVIQGLTDPDGDPVTLTVTAVRQDEPLTRAGIPDATGLGTPNIQIRADRAGGRDGRVYRITFEARDGQGGTCTGTVTVCVPHDQGRGRTCGDGGGVFDSAVSHP
jgi:hypothetical protein